MASKKELQDELRCEFGDEEYPLVTHVKISSLTDEQLITNLKEKNIPIEYPIDREFLQQLMTAAVDGSDEVIQLEMVKIESMTEAQLKEALRKISESKKSIREVQQELAENCGYGDEIIWDQLNKKDENFMKDKIKQLIPDQEKGQKAIERMREDIFDNVWAQRKFTNGNSVTSIFYVMVTTEPDFNLAKEAKKFSCHPVFRCRKCVAENDTSTCCMIYVDETGRVYQNWQSFVEDNVLPAGTMVSPRRGVYNFDRNHDVILDVYCTPNGTAGAKVMNVAQTGSAVLGVGAACVPLAALAMPVAAPLMAGAAVVALGVGAFSTITSALNLTDRKKHEQSISITNSQARGSYLGIAGGLCGMAAAGATRVMTSLASAGKATAGIEILVNGINISSIVLSGSGVANGVLDLIFKYQDDDQITALDVLQLSASLVLFTHSVYNFQLASQIANEARTNSIKSYRETLSNRQRRMFDKMSKETIRIRGDTQGKMDIIRNINKIPDRQYLNDLFKVNKKLNEAKVRPSFGAEGVVMNNEIPVDTGALRQNLNILDQVSKPIPQTHGADGIQQTPAVRMLFVKMGDTPSIGDGSINLQETLNEQQHSKSPGSLMGKLETLAITLADGAVIYLVRYGETFLRNITDGENFQDVILSMAEHFSEKTFVYLLELTKRFMEYMLEDILRVLRFHISTESVLYRMLKHVLRNYQDLSFEFISTKGQEILYAIRLYYLSLNSNNTKNESKICDICQGKYYICM